MSPSNEPGVDFKTLYRKLEAALSEIARIDNPQALLETALVTLLERFEGELGFEGGRIYKRDGEDFVLCCGFGSSCGAPTGLLVPRDYPPHLETLSQGILIMGRSEAGFDPHFEGMIGVGSTFAAIAVGEGATHVIAFSIKGRVREEQVLYSLTALRHVLNLKLQQQKVSGIIEESRIVQEEMLPCSSPEFPGFDIDGRTQPAEIVSGDLFDYIPLGDGLLGLAIADASGHGLPASLLVRDVITGLRMAAGGPQDLVAIMERLNRVIHRASLASKFVSLFYGQISREGRLVYCNAGHNPPILKRGGSFVELEEGGPVLGPIPAARYRSGTVELKAGDLLALYTDGVTERESVEGEPFGTTRLQKLLQELASLRAPEVVEAILSSVEAHGGGIPALDDRTILIVQRR